MHHPAYFNFDKLELQLNLLSWGFTISSFEDEDRKYIVLTVPFMSIITGYDLSLQS